MFSQKAKKHGHGDSSRVIDSIYPQGSAFFQPTGIMTWHEAKPDHQSAPAVSRTDGRILAVLFVVAKSRREIHIHVQEFVKLIYNLYVL
jgi:hypothetical protein